MAETIDTYPGDRPFRARDYDLAWVGSHISEERASVSILGEIREVDFRAQDGLVSAGDSSVGYFRRCGRQLLRHISSGAAQIRRRVPRMGDVNEEYSTRAQLHSDRSFESSIWF